MRLAIEKAVVLGLAVATASVVGCSSNDSTTNAKPAGNQTLADTGNVGLNLNIGPGVNVDTVHYVIQTVAGGDASAPVKQGDIPVGYSTTISAQIGNIPVGGPYILTLTAVDNDGGVVHCTGVSTPFSVAAGQSQAVSVGLNCTGAPLNGKIVVDGVTYSCPVLQSLTVLPSEVLNGHTMNIEAAATTIKGNPLTFAWLQTGSADGGALGSFTAGAGQTWTFRCSGEGTETITLLATDPAYPGCNAASASAQVTCTHAAVDPCSDPTNLSYSCVCQPAGTYTQSNPADVRCQCDTGYNPNANPNQGICVCQAGTPVSNLNDPRCKCDTVFWPAANPNDPANTCICNPNQTTCVLAAKAPACATCATTSCAAPARCEDAFLGVPVGTLINGSVNYVTVGGATVPTSLTAPTTKSHACFDALRCEMTTNCSASTVTACYCGNKTGLGCLTPGAANGVCKGTQEIGLETQDPSAISSGYTDTTKGGGVANALVQCLHDRCLASCFQ